MYDGGVEMRRTDDLGVVICSFKVHSARVWSICELEDGSFVSGSSDRTIKRWDGDGRLVETISGIHSSSITRVMELKSDVIVALSRDILVSIWKVSTGELLHELRLHSNSVRGLEKLSENKFVTSSLDHTIRVWNAIDGKCIETITTDYPIEAITRVRDSIVTANKDDGSLWPHSLTEELFPDNRSSSDSVVIQSNSLHIDCCL